mgnify:CR=1 FL=1
MKKLIFIALMLTGQLFAQIEEGTYISYEYHYQQLWQDTIKSDEVFFGNFMFDIDNKGIRFYIKPHIGRYFPWRYIGKFDGHPTYILSNGSKIVVYKKINGIIWYSDSDSDMDWYRVAQEYHNLELYEEKK